LAKEKDELTPESEELIELPQIIGEPIGKALSLLKKAGLKSEPELSFEESKSQPSDHVIEVTSDMGTHVSPFGFVSMKVSIESSESSNEK